MATTKPLDCGCWTPEQHAHREAEGRYVRALDRGDNDAAWQAHLDMLEANGYHVPERTGRF